MWLYDADGGSLLVGLFLFGLLPVGMALSYAVSFLEPHLDPRSMVPGYIMLRLPVRPAVLVAVDLVSAPCSGCRSSTRGSGGKPFRRQ